MLALGILCCVLQLLATVELDSGSTVYMYMCVSPFLSQPHDSPTRSHSPRVYMYM